MEATLLSLAMCLIITLMTLKRIVSFFSLLHYNCACYLAVGANTTVACKGALQSSGVGGGALFGQAFLMAQFLILNVGDRTIGFAEIAPDL